MRRKSHSKKTILTKRERVRKYQTELVMNAKITNDLVVKKDRRGKLIPLNKADISYREGFISGYSDEK